MAPNDKIQIFENKRIRTAWDEENEEWYFSIVDAVSVLTDSKDPQAYWRKLKQRLIAEGNETVTKCHQLKITATDSKNNHIGAHFQVCSFFVGALLPHQNKPR